VVVKIDKVIKQFHGRTVVNGISLEVERGDLVALIGPSGCGKSTLLRCVNGLETLDSGSIEVCSTVLKSPKEIGESELHRRAQAVRLKAGMVFQSFNLLLYMLINKIFV
jgi:ABC-type polar amino acid transport system ATPase subunit